MNKICAQTFKTIKMHTTEVTTCTLYNKSILSTNHDVTNIFAGLACSFGDFCCHVSHSTSKNCIPNKLEDVMHQNTSPDWMSPNQ